MPSTSRAECLRQIIVRAELRIESRKERQSVFDDRAADIDTGVDFRKSVRGKAGEREVLGVADKALGCRISKNVAVKFVAARFGDDVENTTG